MLRTINLHLFLIGLHRFSTIGHPKALDACYGAHWRLPRPDFHWQAVDSLQNTQLSPIRTRPWRANKNMRLFCHENGLKPHIFDSGCYITVKIQIRGCYIVVTIVAFFFTLAFQLYCFV